MDVVIALDQGSSSSRALAVTPAGRVAARAQFPVRLHYPRPGFIEHDAGELYRTLTRALDEVLEKLPKKTRVLGIGFASQRSTVVLWDADTGRPAVRAPSWMDGRAAAIVAGLDVGQEDIHERTGLYLTPFYSGPKIRFLLEHDRAVRSLAAKGRLRIGPVSSYVLWKLTRGEVFQVDPALAQRMLLYDIRRGDWDSELVSMFHVPPAALPRLAPSAGSWGVIRRKGRKLPVLAVMGDQQSAALGQGGGEEGLGVLNYGTGAFFLLNTGETPHNIPGLLTSVAWQRRGRPNSYFLEGTVHAAGTSFEWLKSNLGLLKNVRGVDAACRRSTHRVLALQAIGGLGAPRWDYRTPTVYWGLSSKTRPEDIVRGVTEAIAFLISDIVMPVRGKKLAIRELRASGGLARIEYLLQFQSDILQQPITRLREREATAMGAASLAAAEAGAPWAAALRAGTPERVFAPALDARAADKLLKLWSRFVQGTRELSSELRGFC